MSQGLSNLDLATLGLAGPAPISAGSCLATLDGLTAILIFVL